MNYRMIIRPETESDIDDSYNWYEDQTKVSEWSFSRHLADLYFRLDETLLLIQLFTKIYVEPSSEGFRTLSSISLMTTK